MMGRAGPPTGPFGRPQPHPQCCVAHPASPRDPSSPLALWLISALAVGALVPVCLALSLMLGAGVLRQGPPMLISLAAGLVVLLPAFGVAAVFRRRMLGISIGLILWPSVVVVGFPLYFPGERADALASGATVLLMPLGLRLEAESAHTMDAMLPGPRPVRPVAPRAEALVPDPVPPPSANPVQGAVADRDQVVLPYDGQGRTLAVQVGLEGPSGRQVDAWMLFDTGATLTTLDGATLDSLGTSVPADSPEVTVRTAAGERQAHLALVDRVWVGGMPVEDVTVSVCDACADGETRGLLGLNVSGLFLVTVDSARQELVLQPRDGTPNRAVDIAPWLGLEATATQWEDGRVEVEVRAHNAAPRTVSAVEVGIRCEDTWAAELHNLPPGGDTSTVVSLPVGADCNGYSIFLERARW